MMAGESTSTQQVHIKSECKVLAGTQKYTYAYIIMQFAYCCCCYFGYLVNFVAAP